MILYRLYNIGEQFSAYSTDGLFSGCVRQVFWNELPTPWNDSGFSDIPIERYLSGEEGCYRFAFTYEQLAGLLDKLARFTLNKYESAALRRIVVRLVEVPDRHVMQGAHQVIYRAEAATVHTTSRPLDKLMPISIAA